MAIITSTGHKRAWVSGSSSLRDLYATGNLIYYSGTVPADADAASTSATALWTLPITGDLVADGAAVVTLSSTTLTGDSVAGGPVTFFRIVAAGDDGTLSTTQARIQGTVSDAAGTGDAKLSSTTLTNVTGKALSSFVIRIPA